MRREWMTAATFVAAIGIAAGCRSSNEGGEEAAPDTTAMETAGEAVAPAAGGTELEGTAWRLVSYGLDEPVPDGIEITAGFAEGRIAGHSACNRYTGPVEIESGTLKTGALVSTKMACPPPQMENETRYLGLLEEVSGFEVADDRLTLLAGQEPTLVFERAEGAS